MNPKQVKRIEALENEIIPDPDWVSIPISAWGFGKDRTDIEKRTGIVFKWIGEDDIKKEIKAD